MGLITVYSAAPCPTKEHFYSIASSIDYLILNKIECEQLSGVGSIEEAARKLLSFGCANIIITLGFKIYFVVLSLKLRI